MIADQYPGLLTRPDEEKLQLAGELLNDVMGDSESADPALRELVESRLADYHSNPTHTSSWSEVKARLLAMRK